MENARSKIEKSKKQVPRSLWRVVLGVGLLAFALDVTTKQWALRNLEVGEENPFIGNFITLQLIYNPGASFSIGEGATWIFTILTVLILGVIIWYSTRVTDVVGAVIIGFLAGGAAGNLVDRLTQPPGFGVGHVVDFLNYNDWFIGNVADIWIVAAAIAMVLWVLFRKENTDTSRTKPVVEAEMAADK